MSPELPALHRRDVIPAYVSAYAPGSAIIFLIAQVVASSATTNAASHAAASP